jgi:hypothetical protein
VPSDDDDEEDERVITIVPDDDDNEQLFGAVQRPAVQQSALGELLRAHSRLLLGSPEGHGQAA